MSKPPRSSARAVSSISPSGSIVSCITPMRNGVATVGLLLRRRSRRPRRSASLAVAAVTCWSSAASTWFTCCLTIGCSTRWPIAPTGPAIDTSAAQSIFVPSSSGSSVNDVCMFIIAPTPLPFACRLENSGSRSSVFSNSTVIASPPRPSGTFTFACQCRSSLISNDCTPGISSAICAGSLRTFQTTSRRAANERSPSTFTPVRPRPRARLASGSRSSSNTRCGGLQESETIGAPAGLSASWSAAQIAWIAAPPPSPIPFVPSGVNGDGDSIAPVFSGGTSSAWGTW